MSRRTTKQRRAARRRERAIWEAMFGRPTLGEFIECYLGVVVPRWQRAALERLEERSSRLEFLGTPIVRPGTGWWLN